MNDNTVLRIKVPAHLYESVKEQLTLKEAKSGKAHYGAGMEVVKEKKAKPVKDGMTKVEEAKEGDDNKKPRSLEELKAVKEKLEKKINEMENTPKVEEKEKVEENTFADPNFWGGVGGILLGSVPILKAIYDEYNKAKTPEDKKNVLAKAKQEIANAMGGK